MRGNSWIGGHGLSRRAEGRPGYGGDDENDIFDFDFD
jgi:hypothetical protein